MDNIFLMCQSGECEACRLAAKEARAHEVFVRDERIDKPKKTREESAPSTVWLKFRNDVLVGVGANQADLVDTSFLTIKPKQN